MAEDYFIDNDETDPLANVSTEDQNAVDAFLRSISGIGQAAVEQGKSFIEGVVQHFQDPLGDQSGSILSTKAAEELLKGTSINDASMFGWGSQMDKGMLGPTDPSTGLPTDKLFLQSEKPTTTIVDDGGYVAPPSLGDPAGVQTGNQGDDWGGFQNDPEPFGTDVLPTLSQREIDDAKDFIAAELRFFP